MKYPLIFIVILLLSACSFPRVDYRQSIETPRQSSMSFRQLQQVDWRHGAQACENAEQPALQTYQHDATTYLIRQNKCSHFESPFMILFIGDKQAVLIDTGTSGDSEQVPIYTTVNKIIEQSSGTKSSIDKVTILHSHSHRDHHQGDAQFAHNSRYSIVGTSSQSVNQFYQFERTSEFQFDLGNRVLTIFAIPGHQPQSIAIYDSKTQWLVSGDTFYPGQIYVRNWQSYRDSIKKMTLFARSNPVDAIIGTHIEMSQTPGEIYPIGSTYQPRETYLPMSVVELATLDKTLDKHEQPTELVFDRFIITPMSGLQKGLSSVVKFFVE